MAQAVGESPSTSFVPVKQIEAGVLNVGYVDAGPANGPAVVLLHGWPYDIHSFSEVSPILASAGFHVVVPYVRGHGSTRFLSEDTMRNGEQTVLAHDAVALMDALSIERAIVEAWSQPGAAAGMINYYRASVRQSQKEALANLRPISAPTLVIWGERDSYLGPELAEPDRDDVPNLDRVERITDASHWVHHDEAERVNQLLIDFFAAARPAE
jgi:pimeloyl-ACP methyl ester carboxylesterase